MKRILEFEYDDEDDFKLAINGKGFYLAIISFLEYLRSEIKYTEHTDDEIKLLEKIRTELLESIEEETNIANISNFVA